MEFWRLRFTQRVYDDCCNGYWEDKQHEDMFFEHFEEAMSYIAQTNCIVELQEVSITKCHLAICKQEYTLNYNEKAKEKANYD